MRFAFAFLAFLLVIAGLVVLDSGVKDDAALVQGKRAKAYLALSVKNGECIIAADTLRSNYTFAAKLDKNDPLCKQVNKQ